MKKQALSLLLVLVLLVAALTITAMADTDITAPAYRNTVSEKARTELSAALATIPAGEAGTAYCPVCNKEVTWYSQGSCGNLNLQTFHWFIQGDVSNTGYYYVAANKSACFYLNGHNVTSTSVVFETNDGATLNIIGNGNETVTGTGYGNLALYGDTIHSYGGTVNLYGGIYQKSSTDAGPVVGANKAYTLNVYNGTTIRNGVNSGNTGGNIGLYVSGTNVNVYGGTISGGNAAKGGNIGISAADCTVTLSGGSVSGGNATGVGGNIFETASTINVSGGTITEGSAVSGGNIYAEKGAVNVTSGTISSGSVTNEGGNLYSDSNTDIRVSGGSFTGGTAKNGGSISVSNSKFTFTGGSISGGDATNLGGNIYFSVYATQYGVVTINNNDGGSAPSISNGSADGYGGNIYLNVYSGKITTIEDLSMEGGTAPVGGGIYITGSGTLNLNDVSFDGGSAESGANLYNAGITVNISGGSFANGAATSQGGNIFSYYGNLTIKDGTQISDGSATIDGGNIYLTYLCKCNLSADLSGGEAGRRGGSIVAENSTLNISDSTISGGTAGFGGAIYVITGAKLDVADTEISGGEAGSGGNLFVANDAGAVTFTGTTISGGTAGTGGNAYISGATSFTNCVFNEKENAKGTGTQIYNDALVTLNGSVLQSGSVFADGSLTIKDAEVYYINSRQGTVTLDGATKINNLNLTKYNTTKAGLLVEDTFTGTVYVNTMEDAPTSGIYGAKLPSNYTADGDFAGKVILNWADAKPWAFHDNGGLVVGNARTVENDGEKNVIIWHKNNEEAAKNYGDAIMMYPGNHDLPLAGGDYVVNVSGWTMNVTGTGTVTFYDSANADYKTYGTVTVTGPTVKNQFATVGPDGNTYYMIHDGNNYSFHRLGMKVNGVSIRPSTAGIYYSGLWQCDELLAAKIRAFGVAVSLDHQPDAGFLRDDKALYTEFVKDEFVSGKSMTSVLINNILEANNANNADRGETGIYATAYIVFEDGTEAGCTAVDNGNVSHSLRSVMELIDGSQKAYLENKQAVDNFYTKWESVMGAWGLENITGATASPAADDTLNILMIGNSYSYYYVQELYDLLAQDGIKANVYNLYKSGCTLEEHYNWWMSGYNGYQFFWKTNEDGYNLVKGNTTMAESLLAENWDVISIQESLFKNIASATTEDLLAQNEVYREKLIPMLKNAFPNAQIYWHQQWGPEAGFRMESTAYGLIEVPDADAQLAYANKEREAAQFISERYGIKIVNTGDAWQTIRTTPEYAAMLPTGGLCARIGENNFAGTDGGDGYHDGDIGGGQYLNACVWYETLTGESCVGKTFKVKTYHNDKDVAYAPYYELSAELVDALQKVAHATVNKQEV